MSYICELGFNAKKVQKITIDKSQTFDNDLMKDKTNVRENIQNVDDEMDLRVIFDNQVSFISHITSEIALANRC